MTTAPAPDVETTWKVRLDGQSGIGKLDDPFVEEFDLPVHIGGHLVEEFDSQLTPIELRRRSCLQRMSTVLGRRVWDNAGSPEVDTNRLMVCRARLRGRPFGLKGRYRDRSRDGPTARA